LYSLYNNASEDYNEGIGYYNDFINYRNKQFTPAKQDAEIQKMLDLANNKFISAKEKLNSIKDPDSNITSSIVKLTKLIDEGAVLLKQQQDWLQVYFTKNKSGRKSMFYEKKVTIFGIPVN
jgi:hypothetical protein